MHFDFISGLFVLMLSTFLGLDVIRRVSRLLHTPLMSLTNAISAIAIVGAVLLAGEQQTTLSTVLGAIVALDAIAKVSPLPGGLYLVALTVSYTHLTLPTILRV